MGAVIEDGSLDRDTNPSYITKGNIVIGTIAGDEARQATALEHDLGFLEALKLYPTAVGWRSVVKGVIYVLSS